MKWIDETPKLKLDRRLWNSHSMATAPMVVFATLALVLWGAKTTQLLGPAVALGVWMTLPVVAGLFIAWTVCRKANRSLHQVTQALKAAAQGDFNFRLPTEAATDLEVSLHYNHFMDQMAVSNDKLRIEIHERQSAEQALIESKALFDVFMAHLPALAIIKDKQGRYLFVNAACRTLLKKAPEEVVGATDGDLWTETSAKQIRDHDQQVMQHNQVLNAVEKMAIGDEIRHHLVTKFPILKNGQPHMLAAIAFDITDKIHAQEDKARLERQLVQAQKMEAIGTLAGGIAHDFNNVLAAILGYVELAQLDARQGQNVETELDHVLKATHRAKDLVRQILTFSRKTEQDRRPLDPEPLVKESLKLLRASLPSTIEIQSPLKSNAALIMANPTQLHQVIMNLCTNAAHAMEQHGGILEVGLKTCELSNADAATKGMAPGRFVELSVRDTGHGITPALQARIFDPYFTTKAKDKGTGMGLAMVHSIVKSHGGTILVESFPGKGTCFRILFPKTEGALKKTPQSKEELPMGHESILFVDDEPFLADLGQLMLTRLGYRVTSCVDPLEALEKIRQAPAGFDLVITDMTMPHMTGVALAEHIVALRPDLPIILCTGYSENVLTEKVSQMGLAGFVKKPITINALACAIRNALDRSHHSDKSAATPPHLRVIANK